MSCLEVYAPHEWQPADKEEGPSLGRAGLLKFPLTKNPICLERGD